MINMKTMRRTSLVEWLQARLAGKGSQVRSGAGQITTGLFTVVRLWNCARFMTIGPL